MENPSTPAAGLSKVLVVAIVVAVVIFGGLGAFFAETFFQNRLNQPAGPVSVVPLPPYLGKCVTRTLAYHAHFHLTLIINGSDFQIPAGVGINGSCLRPMHTHTSDGAIHLESDVNQQFRLGDWFLIWGNWTDNAQMAIFNSTQIFNNHVSGTHTLTMTVNGSLNDSFQNYSIPLNSQSSQEGYVDSCSSGLCQEIDIVITYH